MNNTQQDTRDELPAQGFEFWGEVCGGACFCIGVVLLIFIGAALS